MRWLIKLGVVLVLLGCHQVARSQDDVQPKIIEIHIMLTPGQQAAYPENAAALPCDDPNYKKGTCWDRDMRDIQSKLYQKKDNCETWERVSCEPIATPSHDPERPWAWDKVWAPIGIPVFEDKTPSVCGFNWPKNDFKCGAGTPAGDARLEAVSGLARKFKMSSTDATGLATDSYTSVFAVPLIKPCEPGAFLDLDLNCRHKSSIETSEENQLADDFLEAWEAWRLTYFMNLVAIWINNGVEEQHVMYCKDHALDLAVPISPCIDALGKDWETQPIIEEKLKYKPESVWRSKGVTAHSASTVDKKE